MQQKKISDLLVVGKAKLSFARRDLTQLSKYGITEEKITAVENQLTALEEIVQDNLNKQLWLTSKTEAKGIRKEILATISDIHTRLKVHYFEDSAAYKAIRIVNISQSKTNELLEKTLALIATIEPDIEQFADVGLTTEMLVELKTKVDEYSNKLVESLENFSHRRIGTFDRNEISNIAYKETRKICELGKAIWKGKNPSAFQDYVWSSSPKTSKTVTTTIVEPNFMGQ